MSAPYARAPIYLHIKIQMGWGCGHNSEANMSGMPKCQSCSMLVNHGFTYCRPWFTMVNICLLLSKHVGLPNSTEHVTLYIIISTIQSIHHNFERYLNNFLVVGTYLSMNCKELWIIILCPSPTWNVQTIQQISNLYSIAFIIGIKVSTRIVISTLRVSNFAVFRAPPRPCPLYL